MSLTAPRGFRAAGIRAGIKATGEPDLALVVNDGPLDAAAGVFTRNRVAAAPVLWSRQVLTTGRLRAVVLNSGGANACTGPDGFADTHHTAERAASALGLAPIQVAVCSTGLIGERLPIGAVLSGVDSAAAQLAGTTQAATAAAEAIMTTDTVAKQAHHPGDGWSVGGMAKGAGMLAPGLATFLAVLTTDAVVDAAGCDRALREATSLTFDRLDSDGCMSTNDTMLLLASGASGITPTPAEFGRAVTAACRELTLRLLADAEGATKEITIEVTGAATEEDAVTVARAIARSNLFKTAIYGNDPNWGRAISAVGTTDATFAPDRIDLAINGVWLCRDGAAAAPRGDCDLTGRAVGVQVELHAGDATATVWTNDLSVGYVRENSAYSS